MSTASKHRRLTGTLAVLAAAALAWAADASLFKVDVTEYGAVSRFGRVVRVVEAPGLGVKWPFERVVRVERRLLFLNPVEAEYLTMDKKNLVVRGLAIWRIDDAKRYLETLVDRDRAELQLADLVLGEVGSVLGRYNFSGLVSTQGEASRFEAVVGEIRDRVNAIAKPTYGVDVVDVRIRQLSLPDQNKRYVFERMQAERGRIAMQYRSEGEREAKKIVAAAEHERRRILAEAYREAEQVKGGADAEAMRIYRTQFGKDPQFYKFMRTLTAYQKILDENTTVFLPADADVLRLLQGGSGEGDD